MRREPEPPRDPAIRRWLEGVEPAWTLLDARDFVALQRPPSPIDTALLLATDRNAEEIARSSVARTAILLLNAADEGAGLKLTTTGNLARAVVADLCARSDWLREELEFVTSVDKVINEADIRRLYFLSNFMRIANLLRKHKGHPRPTTAARGLLARNPGVPEEMAGEESPNACASPTLWRKTALFDRFIRFDVRAVTPTVARH